MAKRALSCLFLLVALLLAGCDHATKHAASTLLPRGGAVEIVRGVFDLRYAENRDTAFSLSRLLRFEEKQAVLVGLALVALASISLMWWRRRKAASVEQLGYAFIVGGALGNVLDRALRGYVVDFMHLHRWPVFNVADVAIVIGVGLLSFSALRARGGSTLRST
jgi:signal peptidase II